MTIDSLDAVFYTCIFVLPGFIINGVVGSLVQPKRTSDARFFLSCLAYSIINCAVWSWLYSLISPLLDTHPTLYWLLLILITVFGAAIVALIIGAFIQREVFPNLLGMLKLKRILPQATAWDFFFSKEESAWVIITLLDGSKVMGRYDTKSCASSDYEERDIYVEEVFTIDDNNVWQNNEKSLGIYISKGQIKTIEFLK